MLDASVALLLLAAAITADVAPCQGDQEVYQHNIEALRTAAGQYLRCVEASNGRDSCFNEFGDLEIEHDRFEISVADLTKCRGG